MRTTSKFVDTAVYWGKPTDDGYNAKTFPTPEEISCRWEEKTELFLDYEGKQGVSRAVVYHGETLITEGWLFLGALTDLDSSTESDPLAAGGFEIRRVERVKNVSGTSSLSTAWL